MEKFTGMSRDTFLNTLVAETGKNGQELFDFVREKISPEQNSIDKMVEVLNNSSAAEVKEKFDILKEGASNYFKGTKQGFIDWASFYLPQSRIDVLNKWKTSMTPEYLAMLIARDLGVERFTWIHTAKSRKKNGELVDVEVEYVV